MKDIVFRLNIALLGMEASVGKEVTKALAEDGDWNTQMVKENLRHHMLIENVILANQLVNNLKKCIKEFSDDNVGTDSRSEQAD